MPLGPCKAFETSDGKVHRTLEEMQRHELAGLFLNRAAETNPEHEAEAAVELATLVYEHRDTVLDILALGPRSRVGKRKVAGTANPRRAAARSKVVAEFNDGARKAAAAMRERTATPEQAEAGFKAAREAVEAAAT